MFRFLRRLAFFRFARHAHCAPRSRWKRAAFASAACGACLAGGVALAHPPRGPMGPGPEGPGAPFLHEHASVWLDGLLAEIGANDAQKAIARAARDEALAAMDRTHASGKADMELALQLFAADAIDEKALADLRSRFQGKHAAVEQVALAGVLKLHGQLDATQRQKLIATLKDFRPETRGGFGAAMGKRMMQGRLAQMLDRVKADEPQRATINAVAQRVMKAFEGQTTNRQALFDEALGLLAQPKIEPAAVQRLVARHDADRQAMGDVFVQAARDVHATLRTDQRAAVIKGFTERMGHFRHP